MIPCIICGKTVKNNLQVNDAKWEIVNDKFVCRECAKHIAQLVIDEY